MADEEDYMKHIVAGAIAVGLVALVPLDVHAQGAGQSSSLGYPQNAANRGGAPLSPYLNLLRGGNPAVNYFNGVRPGQQAGGYGGMFNQIAGPRQTFFPWVDNLADLADDPHEAGRVSPTGHPVGFNNTLGYFGPTSGQQFSRGSQQQGAQRRGSSTRR